MKGWIELTLTNRHKASFNITHISSIKPTTYYANCENQHAPACCVIEGKCETKVIELYPDIVELIKKAQEEE